MWMSAGGVIGGVCTALVAPQVFSWIAEYPIAIVAAILCRPDLRNAGRAQNLLVGALFAIAAAIIVVPAVVYYYGLDDKTFYWCLGALLVLALAASRLPSPLAFAAFIILTFMVWRFYEVEFDRVRSFFGVHKVVDRADGVRVLQHGTTIHGAERLSDVEAGPGVRPEPLTYFHAGSAMVQIIAAARARTGGPINVAIVGLGAGTLACYAEPGEDWTYYEIDPAVVDIARDVNRFTYLAACAPEHADRGRRCAPHAGERTGRTLRRHPDRRLRVGHDARPPDDQGGDGGLPRKLKPEGLIALHVSSRYMELVSVVAGIAHANGLVTRTNPPEAADESIYHYSSSVVAARALGSGFRHPGYGGPVVRSQPGSSRVGLDRRLFQCHRGDGAPLAAIMSGSD